jgi:hypothetical protein
MPEVSLQLLELGETKAVFGFEPMLSTVAKSYKLYVSLDNSSYFLLKSSPNAATPRGPGKGMITIPFTEAEVRTAVSDTTVVLAITPTFYKATYVNPSDVESLLADAPSRPIEFEKTATTGTIGTLHGAQITSQNPLYEDNYTVERTIVGGVVTEELIYLTGAPSGSRAKKIIYTAPFSTDGKATKEVVTDALKP